MYICGTVSYLRTVKFGSTFFLAFPYKLCIPKSIDFSQPLATHNAAIFNGYDSLIGGCFIHEFSVLRKIVRIFFFWYLNEKL